MTERAAAIPALAEAFREHGFAGASVTALCAATGLGKGSLYNFFPGGKQEMAAAVLADVDAWFTASVFEPLAAAQAGDPAAVHAMFDAVTAYFRSGRRVCLQGAFALGRERDLFAETIDGYFGRWISSLAAALRAAGHSEPAARLAAIETVAGIQGAIVLSRAMTSPEIFEQVIGQARARLAAEAPGPATARA
jgi:AcrR family transcriptional regulator